jgi:hypothetical protein
MSIITRPQHVEEVVVSFFNKSGKTATESDMTAHIAGRISEGCSDMLFQACMEEATCVARRLLAAEST